MTYFGTETKKFTASERGGTLKGAFDRLIAAHGSAISRLASSYERVESRREELVQDIARNMAGTASSRQCSERTFVCRIAHNRALSHMWKRKPPADESIEELPEHHHPIDPQSQPEEQAAQKTPPDRA